MARKDKVKAIAYLRTSSAVNVGADKDFGKRQWAAIQTFAKAHGYEQVGEFYDAAVSGADPSRADPASRRKMMRRVAGRSPSTRRPGSSPRSRLPATARGRWASSVGGGRATSSFAPTSSH
jgi:DNA invertase Pin-like site-specific DNA recombinase